MCKLYQVVKRDIVKNLIYNSDLDIAKFKAICTKMPTHSNLAALNFIDGWI